MSIRRMRKSLAFVCPILGVTVACGDASNSSNEMSVSFESNVSTIDAVTTIVPVTTTDFATTIPAESMTSGESVVEATTTVAVDAMFQQREVLVGTSVEGRPIIALHCQVGTSRPVLAVGSIHGDESAGIRVTEWLCATTEMPVELDLWVIATVNPDGLAAGVRQNAHGVDLNRNFATDDWKLVGSGTEKFSGFEAGSEVETRSVQDFVVELSPLVVVWWHQFGDYVDDQSTVADYGVLEKFAEVSQQPIEWVGCGSTPCVGNATVFVNTRITGATSFVVELPRDVSSSMVERQGRAFLAAATMAVERSAP